MPPRQGSATGPEGSMLLPRRQAGPLGLRMSHHSTFRPRGPLTCSTAGQRAVSGGRIETGISTGLRG